MSDTNNDTAARSLADLLADLEASPPHGRIKLRDPVIAFGTECIEPLVALVTTRPDLSGSVASWLEVLVERDRAARTDARAALRKLGTGPAGRLAQQALARLDERERQRATTPRQRDRSGKVARRDAGAEVHARLIVAAKDGRLLTYSELETSRGHVGSYLHRIVQEESDAGHPPLTAIVVSKTNRLPGDGFLPAMLEIGYAEPGEELAAVWERAVAEVHAFWRDRP